jgi:hypothetical protein
MSVPFSVPTLMCGIVLLSYPSFTWTALVNPDWFISGRRLSLLS